MKTERNELTPEQLIEILFPSGRENLSLGQISQAMAIAQYNIPAARRYLKLCKEPLS